MKNNYEIAAYYFPNYHQDSRNKVWHGPGWTEWELVKCAKPRFDGHRQPKMPLWGYEDGPYLQRALEEGFLKAENNNCLKFALMWANHDWVDIHPSQRSRPCNVLAKGIVSPEAFLQATEYIINTYFKHPSYMRVNGGLYFSIYELMNLIRGFGDISNTRRALDDFRSRVRAAGLGELHLNAVVWGLQILPGEKMITNAKFRDISVKDFEKFTSEYKLPYYPNVTMGWDSSPRTIQSDVFENLGYPFTPILDGNTPENSKKLYNRQRISWIRV